MKTTQKFHNWFLLVGTLLFSQVSFAQWVQRRQLTCIPMDRNVSVSVLPMAPMRKLHLAGLKLHYELRIESRGGQTLSTKASAGISFVQT